MLSLFVYWQTMGLCPPVISLTVPEAVFPNHLRSHPLTARLSRGASSEYWFYRAGPCTVGVLNVSLWKGIVLQICRSEPAVWDAVVAASLLYEAPPHE